MKNVFSVLRSKGVKTFVAASALVLGSQAHAAGELAAMTTAITGAVDFAPIVTGIGVIIAAVALVVIAMKGGKMLLAAIR